MTRRPPISLLRWSLLWSAVNVLVFHTAFFRFVWEHTALSPIARIAWMVCVSLILFLLNGWLIYLVHKLLHRGGQVLLALCHLLTTAAVWFVNTYSVLMDESMMSNVFNTRGSEAGGFITPLLVLYFVLWGVVPAVYIVCRRVDYGSWKRLGYVSASSLGGTLLLVICGWSQFMWIGEYDTELGGLVMPWSYIVNSCRLASHHHDANQQEIPLPDATISDSVPSAIVLVIGESARRANCSLYDYERETFPRLAQQPDLQVLEARSCATYTTAGVKAILEYKATSSLYEILPNYLYRTGVDVSWRTTNWGEPPVHITDYEERSGLDSVLTQDVKQRIMSSDVDKVLIILHTSTSHGPRYQDRYPREFAYFLPEEDIVNSYDNSLRYTDYLLSNLIDSLRAITAYQTTLIYISDHGESLGENNLFMHGAPLQIAPCEQYEIPCFVWSSSQMLKPNLGEIDQHYIFHSVLHALQVNSPIYNPQNDIFL